MTDKDKLNQADRLVGVISPINKLEPDLDFVNKIASDNWKTIVKYDWANFFNEKNTIFSGLHIENHKTENMLGEFSDVLYYSFQGKFNGYLIFIKIIQAPDITKTAEYFILELEGYSNMMELPFAPSNPSLGTVSIQGSEKMPNRRYRWVYKNIYFHVDCESPEAALALSKILQSLAEKHVVQIAD